MLGYCEIVYIFDFYGGSRKLSSELKLIKFIY